MVSAAGGVRIRKRPPSALDSGHRLSIISDAIEESAQIGISGPADITKSKIIQAFRLALLLFCYLCQNVCVFSPASSSLLLTTFATTEY